MIEQADQGLMQWAATVLDRGIATFEPPDNTAGDLKVHLYLLDLLDCPPARGGAHPTPRQLSLRYLVTTSLGEQARTHEVLGQMAFAAMETPEFEVEFESLDPSWWTAMGALPRPAFFLTVRVRKERTDPTTQLVLHPPVINVSSVASLRGVVMGLDGFPWPGALVELPAVGRRVRSGMNGDFRFDAIPLEPQTKQLRITAKGRVFEVDIEQPKEPDTAVEVRLNPLEAAK